MAEWSRSYAFTPGHPGVSDSSPAEQHDDSEEMITARSHLCEEEEV